MANVVNKAFRYSTPDLAIGNREDEPATDVNVPQSFISLLKAILLNGSVAAMSVTHQRIDALEARIRALEERGP